MEFNELYEQKHVTKASGNVYKFAILNEFFHYYLLQYKIREFDIRGAVEAEQWETAYWAAKDALKLAVKIYLFCKEVDQYSNEWGHFLLKRLALAMNGEEDKYRIIEHLFYSNAQNEEELSREIGLIRTIVKDYLIPNEIWELWGGEKQFNFSTYLRSVIITKQAFKNIDNSLLKRPTYPIEMLIEMDEKSSKVNKGK